MKDGHGILCNLDYYLQDIIKVLRLMARWQQPGDVTDVPKMIYSTNRTLSGSGNSSRPYMMEIL